MIPLLKVLCASVLSIQALVTSRGIDVFILNGEDTKPSSFPHQLQLQRKANLQWKFICSAAILSDVYALTAAHCVIESDPSRLRLVAGIHRNSNKNATQTTGVGNITVHPNYGDGEGFLSNDVAIMRMSEPLRFNENIEAISWNRNNNETFEGRECNLTGWGETHDSYVSDVLQRVNMRIISNENCSHILSQIPTATIYPGHICAFDPPKGSCGGDSGGPMTCSLNGEPILAGITSWNIRSDGSCSTRHPSVYSRMSYFSQWIVENTP